MTNKSVLDQNSLKNIHYLETDSGLSPGLQLHETQLIGFGHTTCEQLWISLGFFQYIYQKFEEKKQHNRNSPYYMAVKWGSLGRKIFREHPAIFYVENQLWKVLKSNKEPLVPYLFAESRVNVRAIQESIRIWYRQEFNEDPIFDIKFRWETIRVEEAITQNVAYSFLPSFYHHQFCKSEHMIQGINQNRLLRFYHCLKSDGTTSCVSELIWRDVNVGSGYEEKFISEELGQNNKRVTLPIAYEVQTHLINKPFNVNKRYLGIHSNLKRFVYWDIAKGMDWNGTFSCIIAGDALYEHHDKNVGVEVEFTKQNGEVQLKSAADQSLFRELYKEQFQLSEFIHRPYQYMIGLRNKKWIAPIFNQYFSGYNMLIEQGIGLQERNEIYHYFCHVLDLQPKSLIPGGDLRGSRLQFPMNPFSDKWTKEVEIWDTKEKSVFQGFGESIGKWFHADSEFYSFKQLGELEQNILVQPMKVKESKKKEPTKTVNYYQYKVIDIEDQSFYHTIEKVVQSYFEEGRGKNKAKMFIICQRNQDSGEDLYHQFDFISRKYHVTLRCMWKDVKGLTSELDHQSPEKDLQPLNADIGAFGLRIQEIEAELMDSTPLLNGYSAVINVPSYHKNYRTKNVDPKEALRKGFIKNGRVTQFINGQQKDHYPYLASIADVLKDSGVYPEKIYNYWKQNDIWIGFDKLDIKVGKSTLPVMIACKMSYGREPDYAFVYEGKWRKLREMMSLVSNKEFLKELFENHKRITVDEKKALKQKYSILTRDFIYNEVSDKDMKYYIVFSATLRNGFLKEMENGSLSLEKKPFGINHENVVFIRYNATKEVPDGDVVHVFPQKQNSEIRRGSGLFYDEDAFLFYSVGAKTDNMQTPNQLNKENALDKAISKQIPREIVIMGEPDKEKRKKYAALVHRMRNCTITFRQEISQVMPIHYIHILKKYI